MSLVAREPITYYNQKGADRRKVFFRPVAPRCRVGGDGTRAAYFRAYTTERTFKDDAMSTNIPTRAPGNSFGPTWQAPGAESSPQSSRAPRRANARKSEPTVRAADDELLIEPTAEQVRERAYYIYLERGGVAGDPLADWLQAERELRDRFRAAASMRRPALR